VEEELARKAEELGITVEELKERMRGFGRPGFRGKGPQGNPKEMSAELEELAAEKGINELIILIEELKSCISCFFY
jgi:hypothetical protein